MSASLFGTTGAINVTSAASITYTRVGGPTVLRTLVDKLSDIISIKDFGAVGDGTTDDTLAIQGAIDYYGALSWSTGNNYKLDFPSGKFWKVSTLTLKKGVSLDFNRGYVVPATSAAPAVFTLDTGPVNYISVSNVRIDANPSNVGQHCFYLYSQTRAANPAATNGGLWESNFDSVHVYNFTGHSFWFRGGPSGGASAYQLPHQFISFRDVRAYRAAGASNRALLLTGQIDQFTFENCEFDGPGTGTAGCNIEISNQWQNGAVIGGYTVGGAQSVNYDDGPVNVVFNDLTCQSSEYGIRIYYSHQITISSGWFESIKYGLRVSGSSTGIHLNQNHLANTGSDGAGTGYVIAVEQSSQVNSFGNNIVGATDKYAKRLDFSPAGVNFIGGDGVFSTASSQLTAWTVDLTSNIASTATLDLGYGKTFLVNTGNPATTITNIKTAYLGQDLITLKAWGGPTNNQVMILGTGGNLSLYQPIILRHMDTVTLQQYDLGPLWTVVGSNIRRSNSADVPDQGYWYAGEFVWKNNPVPANGFTLLGWSRRTTGSGNVLNADWTPSYTQTAASAQSSLVTNLTLNDSSAAACAANAAALNAVIASLAAGTITSGQIIFPDGIVYLDQQFVWTAPPAIAGNLSSFSTPVAIWPEFTSTGTTTFVYKGAALAPAISGFTGVAFWVFKGNGASQNARLRLKNLRFVNNNKISVTKTTLTSAVNVGDISVNVTGTPAVVGDAIAIQSNAIAGMVLAPQWWGTVIATSGTGPQTVTFAAASTRNAYAYSGAGGTATGSIGNIVNIYKQSRAIQVGGALSATQDVFFFTEFTNCEFMDWVSGIAFNDCTWLRTDKCSFTRTMFGIEHGYNADAIEHYMPNLMCQAASRTGCVVTSGNTTFSTPSDMSQGWFPGMGINNITSSTSSGTITFPEEAVIVSITSSSVTMSHPAQQSGTFTLIPCIGTLFTLGEGTSPFYPVQPAPMNNGARPDSDLIRVIEGTFAESRMIYHGNAGTNGSVLIEDCYPEICQRIAIIGTVSNLSGGGPYIFNRMKIQTPEYFTGPAIEGGNGGGLRVKVTDLQGPVASNFAWFKQKGSSSQLIEWERNGVTSLASVGIIQPDVNFGQAVLNPGVNDVCRFCTSDSVPTGYTKNFSTIATSGTLSSSVAEIAFTDCLLLLINGNTTLPNITLWTPRNGSKFKIVVQSTGAFTFTFGTSFVNAAGTAIGTVTATGTNKFMVCEFIADGTTGIGRWILTSGTPAFI